MRDATWVKVLGEHDRRLRACLTRFDGTEFTHTGDGIGAYFASSGDAIGCALAIHEALSSLEAAGGEPLPVRIGICHGETTPRGRDLAGSTVSRTVRVMSVGAGGETVVDATVAAATGPAQRCVPVGEPAAEGLRGRTARPVPPHTLRASSRTRYPHEERQLMTGMQHSVDKGLYFSVLDARYSWTVAERVAILEAMRLGDANVFRDIGTLGSLAGGPVDAVNSRMFHLYSHWFGYSTTPTTGLWDWVAPPPAGDGAGGHDRVVVTLAGRRVRHLPDHPAPGDRGLARPRCRRAGAPRRRRDPVVDRVWPMEFLWICGAPKFDGWVSWREFGGAGHVTVLLVTPAIADPAPAGLNPGISLSLRPEGGGTVSTDRDYKEILPNHSTAGQRVGLWVIGHDISAVVPEGVLVVGAGRRSRRPTATG